MVRSIVITAVLLVGTGSGMAAEGAAPRQEAAAPSTITQGRSHAEQVVTDRMVKLGLTAEEASLRVKSLTHADLQKLGATPEQVGMAGIKDKTLIIIAVILILPSILLLMAF